MTLRAQHAAVSPRQQRHYTSPPTNMTQSYNIHAVYVQRQYGNCDYNVNNKHDEKNQSSLTSATVSGSVADASHRLCRMKMFGFDSRAATR